jgi:hypothetical protein
LFAANERLEPRCDPAAISAHLKLSRGSPDMNRVPEKGQQGCRISAPSGDGGSTRATVSTGSRLSESDFTCFEPRALSRFP